VIPLGNGDDFAKMIPPQTAIGGKVFNWQEAINKISKAQTKLFDVGRMSDTRLDFESDNLPHYFMNGMDIGFGAQAALNFTKVPKFLSGMMAYLAAIMKTLIDYHIPEVTIQIDDEAPFKQSTTMTAITNGRCFGSGFWVCPQAEIDDGMLDVMVADGIGRMRIMGLIPKITKGTHLNESVLSNYQARRIVIDSEKPMVVEADGEIPYPQIQHLEIQILDKKLRVIV
jgi:diacylglycerol kinase family enzyme